MLCIFCLAFVYWSFTMAHFFSLFSPIVCAFGALQSVFSHLEALSTLRVAPCLFSVYGKLASFLACSPLSRAIVPHSVRLFVCRHEGLGQNGTHRLYTSVQSLSLAVPHPHGRLTLHWSFPLSTQRQRSSLAFSHLFALFCIWRAHSYLLCSNLAVSCEGSLTLRCHLRRHICKCAATRSEVIKRMHTDDLLAVSLPADQSCFVAIHGKSIYCLHICCRWPCVPSWRLQFSQAAFWRASLVDD